ncbi:hypothetical protein [Brevundimonas nasdae]|uniref:hypothetical protein n=1 Tax=Brevundimonas nasdae TaxID=172043 RepID=UPI003F6939F7
MTQTRDQLIDLILRETTDRVTADGVQIGAPNILEVGCRYVRGDPKRGYEKPAEAARQFAGFIADAVLALAPQSVSPPFDVEDYVAGYEFRADGEGGSYSPNENERAMLIDAIHGAISEAPLTPPVGAAPPAQGEAVARKLSERDIHRFAVVSSDYSRPFMAGAYETLEAAIRAQCMSPEKWPIYERVRPAPSQQPADDKLAKAVDALEPLARLELPKKPVGNAGAYSILHTDIRRAKEALAALKAENRA